MKLWTTTEAAAETGATYSQLNYWDKQGFVVPAAPAQGSGSFRLWSAKNLVEIRALQRKIEACPYPHEHNTGVDAIASTKRRAAERRLR